MQASEKIAYTLACIELMLDGIVGAKESSMHVSLKQQPLYSAQTCTTQSHNVTATCEMRVTFQKKLSACIRLIIITLKCNGTKTTL